MREPPLGLDVVPDPALEIFFDEILAAPTTEELLLGIYAHAVPVLGAALEKHRMVTNPLADAPSVRLIKFALVEIEEMDDYGSRAVAAFDEAIGRRKAEIEAWLGVLDDALAAAGGLDGASVKSDRTFTRWYSAKPFVYDKVPRRDARFPDPYNMGVNAEAFLYDPAQPPEPKVLMMFYKRLREIDVPEMMASIISETKGPAVGYYRDMTRQLWDEARHAMMAKWASSRSVWTGRRWR
ncbi:MAG: hypothetical protein WDN28_27020 [Chthoniobacter sp.]